MIVLFFSVFPRKRESIFFRTVDSCFRRNDR